jgi:hypothetical protein
MRKPADWLFLSVVDYEKHLDDQEEDPNYSQMLKECRAEFGDPSLVCGKYPLSGERFCPTLSLFCDFPEPEEGLTFQREFCDSTKALELAYDSVQWESSPRFFRISGFDAGEVRFRCGFYERGRTHQCQLHYLVARNQRFEFTVGLSGLVAGPDCVSDDWPGVRDSIRLW